MADLQAAKAIVLAFHEDLDAGDAEKALATNCAPGFTWHGMLPFHELTGAEAVASAFWEPLRQAIGPWQRRPDIFFAGLNETDGFGSVWVVEMGHLMGLWDAPWIGFAPSRKLGFLRYCEFHRIEDGKIAETAHYIDIVNFLAQDGRSPLPDAPGLVTLSPSPRTHDGLLLGEHREETGRKTLDLITAMVAELRSHSISSPDDHLERFWMPDMGWYGPGGIGASAWFHGYNRGHTHPFEAGLEFVKFKEHVARLGEGRYGGFFGYPSITLKSKGYLGQPASDTPGDMRIVDLYRRQGDKLAENWIFIDLPHFFMMQGTDILEPMRS
ncbi:MAG: nuclear transport factor 2 family protein [Pseudomonadota bacterium]